MNGTHYTLEIVKQIPINEDECKLKTITKIKEGYGKRVDEGWILIQEVKELKKMKWVCNKKDGIVKFIPQTKGKNDIQFNLGANVLNINEGLWNAIIKQIKKEVKE